MKLDTYVMNHTGRLCEHCAEKEAKDPTVKSADMIFFKVVTVGAPKADELRELIKNHHSDYPIDLFDGKEHSYIEIGGFVGDQGVALLLMALGSILGLWKLMTPRLLGSVLTEDMVQAMAGIGYISIQAPKPLVPLVPIGVENGGAR